MFNMKLIYHSCTEYLVVCMCIFRFLSNVTDINIVDRFHYNANKISKRYVCYTHNARNTRNILIKYS